MTIAHAFCAAIESMVYLMQQVMCISETEANAETTHGVNIDVGGVSFAKDAAGAAAANRR